LCPAKKCAHAALGCDFLTYEEHNRRYFEKCLSVFVNESQWATKLFVSQLKKKKRNGPKQNYTVKKYFHDL